MIEDVIKVRTELRASGIGDADRSQQRQIYIADAWPDDHVASAVSERARRRDLECFRIKEARWRRVIDVWISDQVGSIHNRTSGSRNVRADNRRQRCARLHSSDCLDLPSSSDRKAAAGQDICTGKHQTVFHVEIGEAALPPEIV